MCHKVSPVLALQFRVLRIVWLSVLLGEHTGAPVLAASVLLTLKGCFFTPLNVSFWCRLTFVSGLW